MRGYKDFVRSTVVGGAPVPHSSRVACLPALSGDARRGDDRRADCRSLARRQVSGHRYRSLRISAGIAHDLVPCRPSGPHRVRPAIQEPARDFAPRPGASVSDDQEHGRGLCQSSERREPEAVSDRARWRPAQLGSVMDRIGTDTVAMFLPQCPTALSGTPVYVPTARVRNLDTPVNDAVMLSQKLGMGSAEAFEAAGIADTIRSG
jgi:hypothetical protein